MKKTIFFMTGFVVFLFCLIVWAEGEMYFGGNYDGYAMEQKNNTPLNGIPTNPGLPLLLLGE